MNVLVFDIETIPDTDTGRKLLCLPADMSDHDVTLAMLQLRRQDSGNDFLQHYLQRIVAISAVLRQVDGYHNKLKVWSLGETNSSEGELIQRFFDGIDRYSPVLVSWNGGGFDLPVLHYRALLHGIHAPRYWEMGEEDQAFRFNNYLSRYHYRHMDVMDILAGYQARAAAPLNGIANMLGLPGKMGKSGASVWQQYYAGEIDGIRDYCETDVLNTYLIYLRFQLLRGKLTHDGYSNECTVLRDYLTQENKPHLNEFLAAWT
ncbi:MAG: 3'-5' exonuclease [Gammaproteobacteria bacterium]